MRIVINLILVVIVVGLVWVLISSIQEFIVFKVEKEKWENVVIDKLMKICMVQEVFWNIKGGFVLFFDFLFYVLKNDSFVIVKVIGDFDDLNFIGKIIYDMIYFFVYDFICVVMGMLLDFLCYVFYGCG